MENKDSHCETLATRRREHAKVMCSIQGLASNAEEYERIIGLLERHIIPEKYPAAADSIFSRQNELGMDSFIYRDLIVKNSGFALISMEWVQSRWHSGLEPGAVLKSCLAAALSPTRWLKTVLR